MGNNDKKKQENMEETSNKEDSKKISQLSKKTISSEWSSRRVLELAQVYNNT